jgi:hypothetical protein
MFPYIMVLLLAPGSHFLAVHFMKSALYVEARLLGLKTRRTVCVCVCVCVFRLGEIAGCIVR